MGIEANEGVWWGPKARSRACSPCVLAMSAMGQKATFRGRRRMSALPSKADMPWHPSDVSSGP